MWVVVHGQALHSCCLSSSLFLLQWLAPALGFAGSSDVCSLSFLLFAQHCFHRGVRSWDGSCCFATRKAGRTILPGSSPCNPPWTLWAPWNPPSLTGESGPSPAVQSGQRVVWQICPLKCLSPLLGGAMLFHALLSTMDSRVSVITASTKKLRFSLCCCPVHSEVTLPSSNLCSDQVGVLSSFKLCPRDKLVHRVSHQTLAWCLFKYNWLFLTLKTFHWCSVF